MAVPAFQFLREPDGSRPIYAVFGDDAHLRKTAVDAIAESALSENEEAEYALSRFAGETAEAAQVLDETRTLPFLSKRRIVVVENADPFVSAHRRELEAYAERPSASGLLVLVVKTWPATTKLAKIVERVGLAIDCKTPRDADIVVWLIQSCRKRFDSTIDKDAAALLLELVGPETGLLSMELEKLSVYVGERKAIAATDVAKMVDAGRVEEIWRVLDAATSGRAAEAIAGLDLLLASGEHPVGLLAAIGKSLQRLHQAGRLRLQKKSLEEACRDAGIPPFAVAKTRDQHAHLGPSRVDRLPKMLLQADLDLKGSSQLPPRIVIERLFLELAMPRRD